MIPIALSEVIRDFVERALLPLLGLGQPENPMLGIQRGALSALLLLTAYLHELVHDPHSCGVKPIYGNHPSRVRSRLSQPTLAKRIAYCASDPGARRTAT